MKKILCVILVTALLFSFCVTSYATNYTFTPSLLSLEYTPIMYSETYTTFFRQLSFDGNNYIANIPADFYYDDALDDPTHKVTAIGIQYKDDSSSTGQFEFVNGMIYTFSGEFYVNSSDTEVSNIGFFMSNSTFTNVLSVPNVSMFYTVAVRAGRRTVNWEAVVEANDDLTSVDFNAYKYVAIEFNGSFEGSIRVQNLECSAFDSYGEDAFYDANISALQDLKSSTDAQTVMINDVGQDIVQSNAEVKDAIDNMWDNEYQFTSGLMPDTGESEDEVNNVVESLQDVGDTFTAVIDACTTTDENPCIYLPKIHIPFLDITIYEGGYFYPLDELNNMNSGFSPYLQIIQGVTRFSAAVGFVFFCIKQFNFKEWVS